MLGGGRGMDFAPWTVLEWLALIERELLLFAGVFFLIGAIDELLVDGCWAWLRLTGRGRTRRVSRADIAARPLSGAPAVLVPAWQEAAVIGHMIAHALRAWPQAELRIYVGCYPNDPATAAAIMAGAAGDPRVRPVMVGHDGPTTKADCLNHLYAAMARDEERAGCRFRMVLLHDAEDMVDPAALGLIDAAVGDADYVQLPVLPIPQPRSRWIGSHYCEEFAEAHGKAMVVRQALSASVPAAGVGCAFTREMLARLTSARGAAGPFPVDSLTEDYELGMRIRQAGGRACFLRARGEDGQLVATRAWFPARIDQAVRQKARWVHGIALQGWDRIGWDGGLRECWMRLRDRRGPLSALVLFAAYLLLVLGAAMWAARELGFGRPWHGDALLLGLIAANLASFAWRAAMRFCFTAHEYGVVEGLRAVLRIPVANIIAIMAARRALAAYIRTLAGAPVRWDKTSHDAHPADPAPLATGAG